MEILRVFPSEGGGEVNCKTDDGVFGMTKADFRRFCAAYCDTDADTLLNCDDDAARLYFPIALSDEGGEELLYQNEKLRALRYALYLLGISDKSTKTLLFKLKQKGFSERAADDAAAVLMQNRRLSDEAFCRRQCELLVTGRHYGPSRVVRELAAKGISSALCRRVLDEGNFDFDGELRLLCEKKLRFPLADRDEYRKAVAKLMRYGYGYEEIRDALREYEP